MRGFDVVLMKPIDQPTGGPVDQATHLFTRSPALNVDKWQAISHEAVWSESIPEHPHQSWDTMATAVSAHLWAVCPHRAPAFIAHSIFFSFFLFHYLLNFFCDVVLSALLTGTQLIHGWMSVALAGRFLSLYWCGPFSRPQISEGLFCLVLPGLGLGPSIHQCWPIKMDQKKKKNSVWNFGVESWALFSNGGIIMAYWIMVLSFTLFGFDIRQPLASHACFLAAHFRNAFWLPPPCWWKLRWYDTEPGTLIWTHKESHVPTQRQD